MYDAEPEEPMYDDDGPMVDAIAARMTAMNFALQLANIRMVGAEADTGQIIEDAREIGAFLLASGMSPFWSGHDAIAIMKKPLSTVLDFYIGQTVWLRSGSPRLIVSGLRGEVIDVEWYDESTLKRAAFPAPMLICQEVLPDPRTAPDELRAI